MSFNPNFLIQGIEVLEGNKVYIRFSGNEKPVVVQGESENYKYLLMPVRASHLLEEDFLKLASFSLNWTNW